MKTPLLTSIGIATALVAAHAAHAQSSVVIYGVLDTAVEHLDNVGPGRSRLTRMPTLTGAVPSRIGFRGTEDLGRGLRAVFTLEQGFGPDTGQLNQGGRVFGRQSFIGLAGPWGTLTLGRQYTMYFWSLLDADILGPNIYGSPSLDSYIPNARADNAIAYRATFGGLTVGATFSLGRDAVNAGPSPAGTNCAGENADDEKACREWSAMVKYDGASWGAALAIDELRGAPGAFAGLTTPALTDTRVSANGYVKRGAWKLGAGWVRRDNEGATAPRSDLWYLGAAYAASPAVLIDGEVFRLNVKGSANRATLAAVRGTYSFSKRTAVYATVGHIDNDGSLALSASAGHPGSGPAPGGQQTGVAVGVRHSF